MTIFAAADVRSFNANIISIRAAVSPPFGRSEQTNYRRSHRDGEVRGPGFAAHINLSIFRQGAKAL